MSEPHILSGMKDDRRPLCEAEGFFTDFTFLDPGHAFLAIREGSRLVPCCKCLEAVIGVFSAARRER